MQATIMNRHAPAQVAGLPAGVQQFPAMSHEVQFTLRDSVRLTPALFSLTVSLEVPWKELDTVLQGFNTAGQSWTLSLRLP
jgi:hypothetical protein